MQFNLDITKVVNDMLQSALPYLSKGGQQASAFASHEFQQYITNIEHIQTMAEAKKITDQEAQFLVNQYKLNMQAILLTVEGLGVIATQKAINAAIDVLNSALNTALGAAFKTIKFTI
jgi:hypothetical protein